MISLLFGGCSSALEASLICSWLLSLFSPQQPPCVATTIHVPRNHEDLHCWTSSRRSCCHCSCRTCYCRAKQRQQVPRHSRWPRQVWQWSSSMLSTHPVGPQSAKKSNSNSLTSLQSTIKDPTGNTSDKNPVYRALSEFDYASFNLGKS